MDNRAFFEVEMREVDSDKHEAVFVAATEGGVDTWLGREYLDMDGLDVSRYESNPVVLDSHNRGSITDIVGRGKLEMGGDELLLHVEYNMDTEKGVQAFNMTEKGFLRAVSVGFMPRQTQALEDGEEFELHGQSIIGPARIVKKWELYEISVVPVGADAEALKRGMFSDITEAEAIIEHARNYLCKEHGMDEVVKDEVEEKEEEIVEETVEEVEKEDERKRQIYALTPRGMEAFADEFVVNGNTVEEARAALKAQLATKAVGTEEPTEPVKEEPKVDPVSKRDITG